MSAQLLRVRRSAVAAGWEPCRVDRRGNHINSSPDRTWELLDVAVSDHIAEDTDPRAGDAFLGIETELRVGAGPTAVLQCAQREGHVSKNRLPRMGSDRRQDTFGSFLARCDGCSLLVVDRPPYEFASVALNRREQVVHQVGVAAVVDDRLCVIRPEPSGLRAGSS